MKYECDHCRDTGYVFSEGESTAVSSLCQCHEICRVCKGAGAVEFKRDGYDFMRPCVCRGTQRRLAMFNQAGVPRRFYNVDLESFIPRGGNQRQIKYAMFQFLQEFQRGSGQGIMLAGGTGVGKTHLIVGLLKYMIFELGLTGEFFDFYELTGRIRAGYGKGISEMDLIGPILRKEVVCIDELGKGRNSEWELGILDQIVSKAYNARKVLLITTNYMPMEFSSGTTTVEPLQARVGSRIYSRLKGMCAFHVLHGPDAREQDL